MRNRSWMGRRAVALAGLALLAAACGGGGEADEPAGSADGGTAEETSADETSADATTEEAGGALAEQVDLSGVELGVGSKEFTEQLILGQIAVQALEAAGATVDDQTGLAGTPVVREALINGDVDLYFEYTGTGWINILEETTPVEGEQEQYEAVRDADAANGVTWLPPAEANNTYALAAGPGAPEDVATISDFAALAQESPEEATLCTAAEFVTRDDGLPGLQELYGFELPAGNVAELDFGLVYTSVAAGDPCTFAAVFATDGLILGNDLTVLEDDQAFFPAYNISMTMRTETYDANAEAYDELFAGISELLTGDTMTELNAAVDVDGEDPADVAATFLSENGIVSG